MLLMIAVTAPGLARAEDDCMLKAPTVDDEAAIITDWLRAADGSIQPTLRLRPSKVAGLVYTVETRVAFGNQDYIWSQSVGVTGTDWVEIPIVLPTASRSSEKQAFWLSDLSVKVMAVDADGDFWDGASPEVLKFLWPQAGDPSFYLASEAYAAVPAGTTDTLATGAVDGLSSDATSGLVFDQNGDLIILMAPE